MWTRKKTVIGGQTKDGDWTILRHQQAVGRVLPGPAVPGVMAWEWCTWTYPADRGRANSFDEALGELRNAIRTRWPDDLPEVPLAGTSLPKS